MNHFGKGFDPVDIIRPEKLKNTDFKLYTLKKLPLKKEQLAQYKKQVDRADVDHYTLYSVQSFFFLSLILDFRMFFHRLHSIFYLSLYLFIGLMQFVPTVSLILV